MAESLPRDDSVQNSTAKRLTRLLNKQIQVWCWNEAKKLVQVDSVDTVLWL